MQDWCSGNIAAFQAVVASSSLVSCSKKPVAVRPYLMAVRPKKFRAGICLVKSALLPLRGVVTLRRRVHVGLV